MNTSSSSSFIVAAAYITGEYVRPTRTMLTALGGIRIYSSNDEGSFSHSPTEEWVFPDNSRVEVGYSIIEETP